MEFWYYHKCLAVKPEDTFVSEMLTIAMEEECKQGIQEL